MFAWQGSAQPTFCPMGLSPVLLPDGAQPSICPIGLSPVFLPDRAKLSSAQPSVFARWGSAQYFPVWGSAQCLPERAQLSPVFAQSGSAQPSVCPMGLSPGPSIKTRWGHSPTHPSYKQECSHVDPLPLHDTQTTSALWTATPPYQPAFQQDKRR